MDHIKEEMTSYWTKRVDQFSDQRQKELHGVMHERWLAEMLPFLPEKRDIRILDIGTGTGYFSFLLGAQGYHMTGIDLTESMITEAKRLSIINERIDAEFYVMDAENPDFPDGSFDAIVTRNLTWALPHLMESYHKWFHLLKQGGVLINFDADYNHEKKQEDLPENHAHRLLPTEDLLAYEHMKEELRCYQGIRPKWDQELLRLIGFSSVEVDEQVGKRIYIEIDEFYNPTPIFRIVAVK